MELGGQAPSHGNVDAYAGMMARRAVNNFAREPVDFYVKGLEMASGLIELGESDVWLDVGCSSGLPGLQAAVATGTRAYLIGLDPYREPFDIFLPPDTDLSQFTFMHGVGEDIPLPDNSVKLVTLHNTLFRAQNIRQMLEEVKRITEPGGLIMISTNARSHARSRHKFERQLGVWVSQETGRTFERIRAPAEGCYLEDVPRIISAVGGLALADQFIQDSPAIITRGKRLDTYIVALQYSASLLVPNDWDVRRIWRRLVIEKALPMIERVIASHEKRLNDPSQAYFPDTVHRGLLIYRNDKTLV
ncbi:MAG TPA: class I SAM-dependent methyltransferase [Candidatus Pristimantibacillus sp.]|jgi:ubiquinone/menaquinone biosynthesis C-methylase UbiE|nr:class I SAM-dependent methyltransferase [Candidatus Pristimantibacillus sp.]